MVKASSPVRLQDDLMQAAAVAGERQHRSAAEQIEYWASLGRSVGSLINPDNLLAVATGLARLNVEPVIAPAIDPDEVFNSLEHDRSIGTLPSSMTTSTVRYQVSSTHPGYLEQLTEEGQVVIGQFSNGVFTPKVDQAHWR
ncbi:MAG: hypothetical protein ACI9SC_002010 [Gammaproteobacteria bacterium]|jgi:hypothetical protein